MSVDATDARISEQELLNAAKDFSGFFCGGQIDPAASAFLAQIANDATQDDVHGLDAKDIANLAYNFWQWSAQKRPSSKEIRLYQGRGFDGRLIERDILEIVGPDSAFLVDSVMGEIGAQGIEVRAMFHPLISVIRDDDGVRSFEGQSIKESMIQVHLPVLPAAKRDAILMGVRETLDDVRLAVNDFKAMKARMSDCIKELAVAKTKASLDEITEAIAFLKWLEDEHFVFLGARSYEYNRNKSGELIKDEPNIIDDKNLGLLRDSLRSVLRRSSEPTFLSDMLLAYLNEPTPIVVAKSNLRSRVHRRGVMDYIGIKRYDEAGNVIGEDRFVGLFTAEAYDKMLRDVPLLRRKVENVIKRVGFAENSHNDKRFRQLIENYPRDELFQIEEEDLLRITMGVQHLMDRPRTRIFVRRDRFDRFMSILVFVPRDKYNTQVRAKIGDELAKSYNGRLSAYYPLFGDTPLARVHYIIGVNPNNHLEPNIEELEDKIAQITFTWDDALEALAEGQSKLIEPFLGAFPAGYREEFDGQEALLDIANIAQINGAGVKVRAYRKVQDNNDILRCKIYKAQTPVALSQIMPIFESMGLFVDGEAQYQIKNKVDDKTYWIHDVDMRTNNGKDLDFAKVENSFEQAFGAIWDGNSENDGFNKLILVLGISWRQASLLRALAKWRGQTGLDPSQNVQEQALFDYPNIAQLLLDLFDARFNPHNYNQKESLKTQKQLNAQILEALNDVPSLDADKVLRRLMNLINNIVRTNYYQMGENGNKNYMSFKITTSQIAEVPNPKPFREVWVWSTIVEGAHLRFGPVARGGLRWSDRRDDFRTEVLGLVKAQQVKNAVIVPVGSKGAFYPKQLPKNGTRDEVQAKGIEAYKTFLFGLLDITDNIGAKNEIIAPNSVIRYDNDDPYLVVAADKGTATFSDIANSVSAQYGHWLGDAFASGGSNGYDHKKMAITAKGAWEAVKRHFRELGHDTQSQEFNVIGVGDMSGDVFGNGMLLSPKIRLIAAFDHRDIFIDPNPNCETSFQERQRMFALSRSSWADYNQELISKGGGIFSRALKSIALSQEMRDLTGLETESATPNELMNALLKSQCDLMWFGGIGTYIKAQSESNSEVGDKANDAIRINGSELNAKVIGEGANLGCTQLGRIEAAQNGVRLNTDAIDNSAGVDSSDHEVNIKILLNSLVRNGQMSEQERDELLVSMTSDVANHVLAHNYSQTLAISLQQATAIIDVDAHERFMQNLEAIGQLNRAVEFLPNTDEMRQKSERKEGLTRPELSVLTAYGKIQLFGDIVASNATEDEWFEKTLVNYFPQGCHQYLEAMNNHRLKKEIIATVLANRIVDLGGVTFMDRARESALADTGAVVRAFAGARKIFELDKIIDEINGLDLKISSQTQTALMMDVIAILRRQTYWLARRAVKGTGLRPVGELVDIYTNGIIEMKKIIFDIVSSFEAARINANSQKYIEQGTPKQLAREVAALRVMVSATDIVDIANNKSASIEATARLYHAIGAQIGFDELRANAGSAITPDHWDRVAVRRIMEDFMAEQASMTESLINYAKSADELSEGLNKPNNDWTQKVISSWIEKNIANFKRTQATLSDLGAGGNWSFAKLSIANTQLKEFATQALA
jgi:glutamate dehydrogenase